MDRRKMFVHGGVSDGVESQQIMTTDSHKQFLAVDFHQLRLIVCMYNIGSRYHSEYYVVSLLHPACWPRAIMKKLEK